MAIDEDGITKKVRDLNDAMRKHGIGLPFTSSSHAAAATDVFAAGRQG